MAQPSSCPCVGIFWLVPNARGVLVTDRAPLSDAEPYGDCLTHPRGHYEVWEGWQRLGPAGLVRQGLPPEIAWHEYEECPRGRIVYADAPRHFVLYADRRLQTPPTITAIRDAFGLAHEQVVVRSDPHYRSPP